MAQRTSIQDVPIANSKIAGETAKLCKITKGQVEEIMKFTGNYIADVIRKGTMEAVMLPNFGKFKPKKSKILAVHNLKVNRANGKEMIWLAKQGRDVIDKRINKPVDET